MNRNEKILAGIDLATASCIEIGALCRPIVPPESPRVFYVDHLDTAGLRDKYRDDPSVDIDSIVHVGGIWGGNTLAEAAATVVPVDYIVASHVIEHVPDLIGWLNELAAALKVGGEVRMAIPDRRYTFDLLRRETQLHEVLEAHLIHARIPSVGRVLDQVINLRDVDLVAVWNGTLDLPAMRKGRPIEGAMNLARDVLENGAYHDVHCWVFTPRSFSELMLVLAENGHLPFECRALQDTERGDLEFLCVLRKSGDAARIVDSWHKLVEAFEALEVSLAADQPRPQTQPSESLARVEALESEVTSLLGRVERMQRTRSWRWSAPLRALGKWGKAFDRRRRGKAA
jgi:hypothetical protein